MGRVAKWAIQLLSFNLNYHPQKVIKSQALAEFIVKWTEAQSIPMQVDLEHWMMYFNGSIMLLGLGADMVLTSLKGDKLN